MARPTNLPTWATNSEIDPQNGSPNKVEPTTEFKVSGLKRREPLPRPYVNYQFDLINDWIEYLDNEITASDYVVALEDFYSGDWEQALIDASNAGSVVQFPYEQIIEIVSVTIPSTAKCRGWMLNGSTLKVSNSEIQFDNDMDFLDLQGGTIQGGLKLAKVATSTTKDQTSVTVYQGHGIVVGDYVTSSLDNSYLPNSVNRTGYIEEGDYNRVTSIVDNGNGTDTINLTYRFFRSEDTAVYSGWIQNAWISGNANFGNAGIKFLKGNPTVRNGTLEYFQGFVIGLDEMSSFSRKSTIYFKDLLVQNTFLDIFRTRCFGVTFDHCRVTRQYDFSKQGVVADMPREGYIKFINGNIWTRLNRDGEIYAYSYDNATGDTETNPMESPLIYLDGSNTFDGKMPADLPESDFSTGGQIYFGRKVATSDVLHWYVPTKPHTISGGFVSNGDKFINYMRSIYGTSFAAKETFKSDKIIFQGSHVECDPVYIFCTGMTKAETYLANPCELIGGHYEARATNTYNTGVFTKAYNVTLRVPPENLGTPQLESFATLANLHMLGGRLDGRWRVNNNSCEFEEVRLPYRGTYTGSESLGQPVFTTEYIGNRNEIQFLLEDWEPNFQGTGSGMDSWNDAIPVGAWFVTNLSNQTVTPPSINFRLYNERVQYRYGGGGGFNRRYTVELYRPRGDLPILSTGGKFSGLLVEGDKLFVGSSEEKQVVEKSEQFLTTNASGPTDIAVPVELNGTPSGIPDLIGIYDDAQGSYKYYLVASVSGNTVTPQDTYISVGGVFRDFAIGDQVTLIYLQGSTATALENYAHYKGSFDGTGALLPEIYLNISNVLSVSGGVWSLDFNTPFFVDNYNTTVYDPASPTTAFTVVPRLSLNNVARNNMGFMIFKADANGALTQVTTNSGLSGCVFEFYAQEADYRGNV